MTDPFRIVVADPPWLFRDVLPGETRGASKNYPCLSTAMICQLAETLHDSELTIMDQPIARDAVLFLWRVASQQQEALDVIKAWGFTLKTEWVWLKKTTYGKRWFGMGHIVRAEHEVCLIATRGHPHAENHAVRSTFVTDMDIDGLSATVEGHSTKPEKFYEIVELLYGRGPFLELFARKTRDGWTSIGDELCAL